MIIYRVKATSRRAGNKIQWDSFLEKEKAEEYLKDIKKEYPQVDFFVDEEIYQ